MGEREKEEREGGDGDRRSLKAIEKHREVKTRERSTRRTERIDGWNYRREKERSRERERERFEMILEEGRYLCRESGCFGG